MTSKSDQPELPQRPPTIPYESRRPAARLPDSAAAEAPPPPPPPPRAITAAVRRRAWQEPVVRFWWLAGLALLFISVWFVVDQTHSFFQERRLISKGVPVTAKLLSVGGETRSTAKFPPETPVDLQFTWRGQTIIVSDVTLNQTGNTNYIQAGQSLALHVDPNDPTLWTDRTQAEPMARRLIAGVIIVPATLAMMMTALLLRLRVLRTWRHASAQEYVAFGSHSSALAPWSHAVDCAPVHGRDARVVTVYLPGRLPRPPKGQVIWLLHPHGNPNASIAVAAYE